MEQIGMLYSVETIAGGEGASHERRALLRQELSCPIICGFEAWALFAGTYPPTLTLHHRWQVHVDNNFIENNVRPLALVRENYLFCGNHDAAENAAIIYTFMGCSKLAQVDVRKWLNFKRILTIRGLLMAYVSSASVRLRSIRTLTLHSS